MFRKFTPVFGFFLTVLQPIQAQLKYEQETTLTRFTSREDLEKIVHEFCKATIGDPNITVVSIRYSEQKISDDTTCYNGIINCFVSEPDKDVARITAKAVELYSAQNK